MRQHEISGRVAVVAGDGGLPKVVVTTSSSAAEIYPHGAHITHFQKTGEPPLIFVSRKSHFAPGQAIRGGVPICYPWFGSREGGPSHGFARITEWQLVETSGDENSATLHFALPKISGNSIWNNLRTEFVVTISDGLTMELVTANESCDAMLEIENCVHAYFHVGDIAAVSIAGLQGATYLDNSGNGKGALKTDVETALHIAEETNRLYLDTTGPVEIRDDHFKRVIRVEKTGSHSTVVWNPWTTQKLPDDFDPAEHKNMVCVESGNVKKNKISLKPGETRSLKVILSSAPK